MKCVNCLNCKLKIDQQKGKYYLGFVCKQKQLKMQERAYALTKTATDRVNPNCECYDPMEESLDWIESLKKSLHHQVCFHENKSAVKL